MSENENEEKPAPMSAEQRKAHVEALKVEQQLLAGREDATGKRRAGEVAKQLEEFGEKPTSRRRETA